LAPVAAAAQTPGWLTDEKSGCRMWVRSVEHLNGFTWSGACIDGLVSGPGDFTLTLNGETFWTGTNGFVKGKREGHGIIKSADGYSSEADYKEGVPDGHMVEHYPSGDSYDGEFHNGARNGAGTFTWHDGARYVGNIKNNLNDGQGTFTFPDGSSYTGGWKASLPDGQGVYRGPPTGPGQNGTWSGRWRDGCFLDGEGPVSVFRRPEECATRQ
jgi:hypothetical protein